MHSFLWEICSQSSGAVGHVGTALSLLNFGISGACVAQESIANACEQFVLTLMALHVHCIAALHMLGVKLTCCKRTTLT